MKRILLVNGIIAGVIVSTIMGLTIAYFMQKGSCENGMLIGYTSMVVAFSFIYVGVKNYRDRYLGGGITFGKAFKVGLGIALIGSTIYVITWLILNPLFFPDFAQMYANSELAAARAAGASEAELAKMSADMAGFIDVYKKPLINALFTYMEILPVGLLISLISAGILKRKQA